MVFIHSLHKHLLLTYYMPAFPGTGAVAMNMTKPGPMELTFWGGRHINE